MEPIIELLDQTKKWFDPSLEGIYDEKSKDFLTAKASMYSLTSGGKRVRPCFMYVVGKMLNADMDDVLVFARSLEMIHTYSLIHDDLPCMDNDDLRRGKPTCHKVYGDNFATLAGDCLLNRAAELVLKLVVKKPQYAFAAYKMFECSGIDGMLGGQDLDLTSMGQKISAEVLHELHERKTGALLEAAICTPVYLVDGDTPSEILRILTNLSKNIGLAFQIKDDILDLTADEETLGKTAGKDIRDDKPTYATVYGIERAKLMMEAELDTAYNNLDSLEYYGCDTKELRLIVDYVASRDR